MLEAYGQTDVGRRRKLNEDNFLVETETSLFAVCDGMGGHNAGEVASKMAIDDSHAVKRPSNLDRADERVPTRSVVWKRSVAGPTRKTTWRYFP